MINEEEELVKEIMERTQSEEDKQLDNDIIARIKTERLARIN